MRDIQDKTDGTGDILAAAAFNTNFLAELQGFVESAGFTLDVEAGPDTDTEMFKKSVALYSQASMYFDESGAADAYVLTRVGTIEPLYDYVDGTLVMFKPDNANTGASTINVDSLGVKDLVDATGGALTGGELVTSAYTIARYNSSTDDFEIVLGGGYYAVDAAVVHIAGAEDITGNKTFLATTYIANNTQFQAKDSGGVNKTVFFVNSSDELKLGDATLPMHIRTDGTLEIQNSNVILNNNYKLQVEDTVGTAYNVAQLTSSDIVQLGNISYPTLISSDDTITLDGVTEITPASSSGHQPALILSDPGGGGGEGCYIQWGQANTADLGRIGINSQSISVSGDAAYMYFSTKNSTDSDPVQRMQLDRAGNLSILLGDFRIVTNNEFIYGYTTGASARDIIGIDSSDIVQVGNASNDLNLRSTGTLTHNGDTVFTSGNLFDPTPDTDETANGITATKTVDTNATGFGALLYLASDGNYDEADASAAATMPCTAMALASGTGSKLVLKEGYVRDDSWAWTVGGEVFVSTTTGAITQTAPSGTGDQVQCIGVAETATIIYFDPDLTVLEIA